jgi:hypothetical protein
MTDIWNQNIEEEIKELLVENTPYGEMRIVSRNGYYKIQEKREKMDMNNPGGTLWVDISAQQPSFEQAETLLKKVLSDRKALTDREAIRVDQRAAGQLNWDLEKLYTKD